MKALKRKMKANGLYLVRGNSAANALFFEDKIDQKLFLKLLNRFLGNCIEIYFYNTHATGWELCFKTKDETSIRQAYVQLKKKSKKKESLELHFNVGKILSEHFRFFLSAYVKQSNFRHGRKGVLVRSKMEKYIFETQADFEKAIAQMKEKSEFNRQRSKYRPNKRYYLVEKQLKRDSALRSSFVGLGGEKLIKMVLPCFREMFDKFDLLREMIINTWNLHLGTKTNPYPPPAIE